MAGRNTHTVQEHVFNLQHSGPTNALLARDGALELGSVRASLTCMKQFWNLSNAASFIKRIIVVNLEDDQ